ncbi:MAG: hypothetical protein EPN21_16640 [Methylococcaceae bacterium]|nr:MAG: hypothetical protein EPN21_16640 [Methylococcaceae bacterium]
MSNPQIAVPNQAAAGSSSLLMATALTFASLILLPAVAAQVGMSSSVSSALRIALMKAAAKRYN